MKQATSAELTVSTVDRRRRKLTFKAFVYAGVSESDALNDSVAHQTLVDIRLSRGDGLEFKRRYDELLKRVGDMVIRKPSCTI